MRSNILLVLAVAAMILVPGCSKPEESIADHVEEIANICSSADSPKEGAEKMREYMHSNLPDILQQLGEALVELDKIESDTERKERLEEMLTVVMDAAQENEEDLAKCGSMYSDPEAMKVFGGVLERFQAIGLSPEDLLRMY